MVRLLALLVAFAALVLAGCGGSSPKGPPDLLFVSVKDGDYAIFGADAEGKHARRLTEEKGDPSSPSGLFFQVEPAWSPDGRQIAFASHREGTSHIFVMQADGTGTKRLTNSAKADDHPAWSPDGTRITFDYRQPGFSIRELWVMPADGHGKRQLTKLGQVSGLPKWSPDGRRLAFQSNVRLGHFEIYTIGAYGKGLRQVTQSLVDVIQPAWSPDGSRIAFSRDGAIWVDENGTQTQLTSGKNNDSSPAWRPVPPK